MVSDQLLGPPWELDEMKCSRWAIHLRLDASANERWFVWFNLFVPSSGVRSDPEAFIPLYNSEAVVIGSDPEAKLCVVDGDILEFEMNYRSNDHDSGMWCFPHLKVWIRSRRHSQINVMCQFPKDKPHHFMAVSFGPQLTLSFVPPNSVHRSKK